MKGTRYFYLWSLPLAFALISIVSFHFPGDEYALWAFGSFPGIWAALIKGGDIHGMKFPVAIGGAMVMAFIGWRMDKMPVKKAIWLGCATALALIILLFGRPAKTHVTDIMFCLMGVGLWVGSLLAILITFVMKHWVRATENSNNTPQNHT